MRYLVAICILAMVVAVALPAFAETQNVKVSGKITERWIIKDNVDLNKNSAEAAGLASSDGMNYIMSQAEVQIDADLTDNVSTCIRLLDQRNWDDQLFGTPAAGGRDSDFKAELAYVTLKEMLYSPLTLRIGRQNLWFGRGFVVGAKLMNPGYQIGDAGAAVVAGSAKTSSDDSEFTAMKGFDAIRATLDYDPWTIDAIYSTIHNGAVMDKYANIDLYGINVGYKFDSYNAEAEAYWFLKWDETTKNPAISGLRADQCHTLGLRAALDPVTNLTVAAEGAIQVGWYARGVAAGPAGVPGAAAMNRKRQAFAGDISAEYRFVDMTWKPTLAAEYIYYSGNPVDNATGKFKGWDPMFRGKFDTAIREWMGWMYYSSAYGGAGGGWFGGGADASFTNQHQILITGTVKPTDTLKLAAKWGHFAAAKRVSLVNTNKSIGDEVDLQLTYDYTEDVEFGLLAGWFFPGKVYPTNFDDMASELVASVAVDF